MATNCSYEFRRNHFGFSDCTPVKFYVSQWGTKRDWRIFVLIYKTLLFCYALSWIIADVTVNYQPRYWIFLTNWTEVTGCLYLLLSLVLVAYGFVKKDRDQYELNWFEKIVWVMFTTAINAALLTDLTFWVLLSGSLTSQVLSNPFNIQEHAINYLILLIDLFLNDIPIRLLHFIYPMGYAAIYVLFVVILWASGFESAVYPVLNWDTNPLLASLICLGSIFIAMPIIHAIHFGLYHLRSWLARHCLNRSTNTAPIDDRVEMNETSQKV